MENNYQGVIIGKKITDFVAGVSSPTQSEVFNLFKEWGQYRSEHELQNRGFETYGCTVFSGLDCQETLMNYYISRKLIKGDDLAWLKEKGYMKDNKINFSDRLPAQYAKIQIGVGTYQYEANDAIRKYLIPESMLPFDKNYYDKSVITQEMIDLSEEFKKKFTFNWFWSEDISESLKKSPLGAVVRFANGDGILAPSGTLNHCIMVYGEKDGYYEIDDNYNQQDKKYRKDYVYSFCGYTLTINNKNMDATKFIEDNDLRFVRNTNTGQFGRIIQGKLRTISTTDRGTLMLLDNEHRKSGLSITNDEWRQLPKAEF